MLVSFLFITFLLFSFHFFLSCHGLFSFYFVFCFLSSSFFSYVFFVVGFLLISFFFFMGVLLFLFFDFFHQVFSFVFILRCLYVICRCFQLFFSRFFQHCSCFFFSFRFSISFTSEIIASRTKQIEFAA